MKYLLQLLYVLSLTLTTISSAETHDESIKVLFIGNSFTGANYLPTVLQKIALANDKKVTISAEIKNGTSLYQHWDKGEAQKRITSQTWDYVILQDSSASALEHPDKTLKFGKLFSDLAIKHNAKPLLFNTWAYKGIPSWVSTLKDEKLKAELVLFIPTMFEATNSLYQQLSNDSHSKVVPVAQVWNTLNRADALIDLHAKDKSHPSPIGTYLTAIVFYQALFNELPKTLPTEMQTQRNQKKLTEMITIEVPKALLIKMLEAVNANI